MTDEKKSKSGNNFARFSTVGIQMGVIIGGFAWLGVYLDERQQNKTPGWTIGLSLFGVFAGLYLMIKEVINMNKRNDN